MSDLYTSGALAEASGASMRQVDHWTSRGWLIPLGIEGRASGGSGNHRIYGLSEVAVARALLLASDRMAVAQKAREEYEASA